MAVITIAGAAGCRSEEVARIAAQRLNFELITPSKIATLLHEGFRDVERIPDKAYAHALTSVLATLATKHHVIACIDPGLLLFRNLPGALAVLIVAPEARRVGAIMLDRRTNRTEAKVALKASELEQRELRKRRSGRTSIKPEDYDIVLNEGSLEPEALAEVIAASVRGLGLEDRGLLSQSAEAQLQFQIRLQLSRHGITPAGQVQLKRAAFVHPSEEIFANLLDFYGISWEYEPRSFAIQWDKAGHVLEAFTPDFYLPEFDLYVELTTMKQALVTKKNRKVKLLKTIYPDINIQVFYQKDFQNLIFKYGLAEKALSV